MTQDKYKLNQEIARRRTFAIISHPDAGKTTLTEKLLLYGGALRLAGSVTARKKQRETASDWMELEKKRGISISSTVLQFDYGPYRLNLLDTPGHKDFSEDTYRVLTAVDGVIMVIDAGKGIEAQTRKLFEICRKRGVPLFTFMNKLDRPARAPLDLIDELESVLQLHAYPVNWPLGMGAEFKGIYDRRASQVHLFERLAGGGAYRAPVSILNGLHDPKVAEMLEPRILRTAFEEIELLDEAHGGFEPENVLAGISTPVYFGSASNNFGVQLLLDGFLAHSSPPRGRIAENGMVEPSHDKFSAYIFKIQTNMDVLHRDQIAFLRVCSGHFQRDMPVVLSSTGKKCKLSNSHKVFGQDREIVDEAYAGDIIGVVGKDEFRIGDTLTEDPSISYREILTFAPECFGWLQNPTPAKHKPFRKGLDHLLAENIVQVFHQQYSSKGPLFGAVGPLQFEVLQYRLKAEYGADTVLERGPWQLLRWLDKETDLEALEKLLPHGGIQVRDANGNIALLFPSGWSLNYFIEQNPELHLLEVPPQLFIPKS
ncbi:MAG: peptide chain release factor 3 [Candidatus Omnitrophica bacterium]|nr:peptide chain release factor 3 [Candidatus Omnitrophota bacterium]